MFPGKEDFIGNVPRIQLPEAGDPAGTDDDLSEDCSLDRSLCGRVGDVGGSEKISDKWGESRLKLSGTHHRVVSRF